MDLALALPPDGPRGTGLLTALREAILSGRLTDGERLPASRALAAQLGLARGTVVAAYEELVSEGYCTARRGAGTFVNRLRIGPAHPDGLGPGRPAERSTVAPPNSSRPPAGGTGLVAAPARDPSAGYRPLGDSRAPLLSAWGNRLLTQETGDDAAAVRYDFRGGAGQDVLPLAELGRALRRAALQMGAGGGPGDPAGVPRLRQALASYLARARGLRAGPEQIVIVSGAQQGFDLITRLLIDPGDRVCVEQPGYPRAHAALRALGARLMPIPVDGNGAVSERLPSDGARAAHVTPSHQYPTGAVLSPERRLALLGWAQRHDAWVIEDDYDSEFRYDGPPLPCLQALDHGGRGIYLGSLSKLLHPALRIGYLVAPPSLARAVVAAKGALDQSTTPVLQEALADLFEAGEIERHLRRATRIYRERRTRLLDACARNLPEHARLWPVTGGLHGYLEVPGIDAPRLLREARRRGAALTDASACYLAPPRGAALTLWFGRIAPALIAPGIAALGDAIRACLP